MAIGVCNPRTHTRVWGLCCLAFCLVGPHAGETYAEGFRNNIPSDILRALGETNRTESS